MQKIKFVKKDINGKKIFLYKCFCGKSKKIREADVNSKKTKSCGCIRIKKPNSLIHGMAKRKNKTRFYRIWQNMKDRCSNEKTLGYKNYGGRGIKVCESWTKFKIFFDDMHKNYVLHIKMYGEYNTFIERINNDNGYNPSNCRWATRTEQNMNKRSNNLIKYKNSTLTLTQWAKKLKIKRATLNSRINLLKWSVEDSLSLPVKIQHLNYKLNDYFEFKRGKDIRVEV